MGHMAPYAEPLRFALVYKGRRRAGMSLRILTERWLFRMCRLYLRCQRAYQTRVTFKQVLLCRKKHLATYMQTWKGSIS